MKILEQKSEITLYFPGMSPLLLDTFAKNTPFDSEIRNRYNFPEVEESKDAKGDLTGIQWKFGRKQENNRTLTIVMVGMQGDRIRVSVAGNHSSCDEILAEIIESVNKYSGTSISWEDTVNEPAFLAKVQTTFDTRSLVTPGFLSILESLGKSIYSDDRLAVEIHPNNLNYAFVFKLTIPEVDVKGKERSRLSFLADNVLNVRITASNATEFESGIFNFYAPIRSEDFMPLLKQIEELCLR